MRGISSVGAEFQSTPSGGKATARWAYVMAYKLVSIHAFRGEGDFASGFVICVGAIVSIHAFRGEGDGRGAGQVDVQLGFNPRLPGGRRHQSLRPSVQRACFNPRLPGGRRPLPEEEAQRWLERFNPRLPGGRRLPALIDKIAGFVVSIHAFRGEGDEQFITDLRHNSSFNPRLPGGRRRDKIRYRGYFRLFQSTPSGGKATDTTAVDADASTVSIHAFRGEGDVLCVLFL